MDGNLLNYPLTIFYYLLLTALSYPLSSRRQLADSPVPNDVTQDCSLRTQQTLCADQLFNEFQSSEF